MAESLAHPVSRLVRKGSQWFLDGFPVLGLPDEGRAVKYFSINPFLPDAHNRCPLECAYCVCHQDRGWHHDPERFHQVSAPAELLDLLLDVVFATPEAQRGFPLSLCDYSDPFLPAHRERVLAILDRLIDRSAANLVYITTKVHPGDGYLARLKGLLERPHALRPTVFVSLPPLKPGYESVSLAGRVRLLQDLTALGIPCCWYVRPLVEEWFDADRLKELARQVLPHVRDNVILSGVVMAEEIEAVLTERGLTVLAWDRTQPGRKQPLPPAFEERVRTILRKVAQELHLSLGPIMSHRLCGTNGNHAYGCLLCGKQDRYCQLFQLHHYGETVAAADNQRLKRPLREQALAQRQRVQLPLIGGPKPTADVC